MARTHARNMKIESDVHAHCVNVHFSVYIRINCEAIIAPKLLLMQNERELYGFAWCSLC